MQDTDLSRGVTVIVPTLGTRADWLRLSLTALQEQNIPVNVVIVGPDTAFLNEIAREFRATLLRETGTSLSAAINQGILENSHPTPYIAWIADDDVLAPNSLALSSAALDANPGAPFAFGRIRYIDGDGNGMWLLRPGSWSVPYAKYGRNFIPQPGSLQRLSAWHAVGGLDETLSNAMDLDLFLKMAALGRPVYIARELASFRVHDGSISVVKAGQATASEAQVVARGHRRSHRFDLLINATIRVCDRVLLSAHRRIPGPPAALRGGQSYHRTESLDLDETQ